MINLLVLIDSDIKIKCTNYSKENLSIQYVPAYKGEIYIPSKVKFRIKDTSKSIPYIINLE